MKIRFQKERTQLATNKLYRTGIFRTKVGQTQVEVLRHEYFGNKIDVLQLFGQLSYDVCLSRGNSWDWVRGLRKITSVQKIIKDANKYGLTCSSLS